MVISWNRSAKAELKKTYDYIALDSIQNALGVKNALIDATIELSENPEKYPLDKLKIDNDGTWRAFELFHYRISYRIFNNGINIVD